MKLRFLLIDKDDKLFSDIKELMRFHGYDIDLMNASEIRAHHRLRQYELIILGVLPSKQRMFNKLKKYATSILCIADKISIEQHAYLASETNEYILKPFLPEALLLRIQELVEGKPANTRVKTNNEEFRIGSLSIRPITREIRITDRWISCRPKTFDLLCHFIKNPNRLFTRQELIHSIWRTSFAVSQRTVDALVKDLRRKIEDAGFMDAQIITVFGKGYMFLMPS